MVETTVVATQVDPTAKTLDHLSAVDIADLLLASIALGWTGSISVEPFETGHEGGGPHHEPAEPGLRAIRGQRGNTALLLATLRPSLADATVARLAILARLSIGARVPQIGRLCVRMNRTAQGSEVRPRVAEIFLAIRTTPGGLVAELRRIAAPGERAARPNEMIPDATGALRVGNYRILAEIGRGGMGIVYSAEHVTLKKPVAIKVLASDLAGLASLDAQFVVEARAACRARHPGIVDVTDFGELPDGRSFLVMELVEWETLETTLRRGPLPIDRALHVARQIAAALRVATDHGVVHRDLKPSNIFVSPDEDLRDLRVKIGDFGIASVAGEGIDQRGDALHGRIMGTAAYMAPEQAESGKSDPRNDLYSLGCVLFEMLAGHEPYRAATFVELLDAHLHAPIPQVIVPGHGAVPETVERVVRRALAKSAAERYQSAGEMIADLDRALAAVAKDDWRRWLPG